MIYDPFRRRRVALDFEQEAAEDQAPAGFAGSELPITVEAGSTSASDAEARVAETKARLKALTEDPDYWLHRKPDVVARVTRAFGDAYGTGVHATDATGRPIDPRPRPIDLTPVATPRPQLGRSRIGGPNEIPIDPAVWRGGNPALRDLRFDPARDRPDILRVDAYDQERLNQPPWTDPAPPHKPSTADARSPTHRDAERAGDEAQSAYERNVGRDRARYPVIGLSDEGSERRINAPLLYNESKEKERTHSILDNTPGRIVVHETVQDDGEPSLWEFHGDGRTTVAQHDRIIRREATRFNVDPDLVRAIMYVENARGRFYGRPAERIGYARSILPMNIRYDVWSPLGFSREDFFNPEMNIRAGVMLIRRIQDRLENPTVAKVAQLYNNLAADEVRIEGARAAHAYKTRAWEKP
jgi:hypothetical protein